MPKEVRAILFTADEVRGVAEHYLRKGSVGAPAHAVERVQIETIEGGLRVTAHIGRGADETLKVLGPQDLMTAILMYCGHLRIPLSHRALKQLELASNGLMLTMSLNQESSAPRVTGNAVDYSAPLPAALKGVVSADTE